MYHCKFKLICKNHVNEYGAFGVSDLINIAVEEVVHFLTIVLNMSIDNRELGVGGVHELLSSISNSQPIQEILCGTERLSAVGHQSHDSLKN